MSSNDDAGPSAKRARIDWVARYGAEEFVIVLPDTDRDAVAQLAERLRVAIESRPGQDQLRRFATAGKTVESVAVKSALCRSISS